MSTESRINKHDCLMTETEESVKRNSELRNHEEPRNNGTRGDAPLAKRHSHNKSSHSSLAGNI